jgi:hypothetical protein
MRGLDIQDPVSNELVLIAVEHALNLSGVENHHVPIPSYAISIIAVSPTPSPQSYTP